MAKSVIAFLVVCTIFAMLLMANANIQSLGNWTSDTSNLQLINTIYSLLLVPEFSDPINAVVTLNFHWDEVSFRDEVKEHIKKHATKTRAEWKAELVTDN
jgi:ubiquitin-protein ligase